ncbi:MAG: GIY-YIG nuclease family protein [Candidatus Omnitrophica bacterium]|nr:GIY-YIG nuclease family protein [Candidatus Omnitrophota bacterium]
MDKLWYIYIVKCKDGLFYTGITKDLKRRVKEHSSGNGCRFTRCRAPVKLMHSEIVESRSLALKREIVIKRLPRKIKLKLIKIRNKTCVSSKE